MLKTIATKTKTILLINKYDIENKENNAVGIYNISSLWLDFIDIQINIILKLKKWNEKYNR